MTLQKRCVLRNVSSDFSETLVEAVRLMSNEVGTESGVLRRYLSSFLAIEKFREDRILPPSPSQQGRVNSRKCQLIRKRLFVCWGLRACRLQRSFCAHNFMKIPSSHLWHRRVGKNNVIYSVDLNVSCFSRNLRQCYAYIKHLWHKFVCHRRKPASKSMCLEKENKWMTNNVYVRVSFLMYDPLRTHLDTWFCMHKSQCMTSCMHDLENASYAMRFTCTDAKLTRYTYTQADIQL